MKIIEALKKVKELRLKQDGLILKIQQHSADLDFETPLYPDTKEQVAGWLQAVHDLSAEILKLRIAVQRTNLETIVAVEVQEGRFVKKSIAEWIHRRKDLANIDRLAWNGLTDRGLKEGNLSPTIAGGLGREVKIRRYFDPKERDSKIDMFRNEPSVIDRTLEVVNATTDLLAE